MATILANINLVLAWIIAKVIGDGKSATFGSLVAETEVRMNKTGNPLIGRLVTKITKYNVTFNANYQNAVNNQQVREGGEGNFEAQGNWFSKGFDPYNGSIVVKNEGKNKGKFYLSCIVNGSERLGYFVDGKPATEEEVNTIRTFKVKSSTPQNQGTEKPIIFRTFMLENIKEIHANGEVLQMSLVG